MIIEAQQLNYQQLNQKVKDCKEPAIQIKGCMGHRFIAAGSKGKHISIQGIPGNALGCYLNGSTITVEGNAQDATGDTMNQGCIVVKGSVGDAAGYAMRGGCLLVRGNAGYRCGIHMKSYQEQVPAIVIGGNAGSFLGEYQAGGIIIVLGLDNQYPLTGNFCATGMHGGKIFLRTAQKPTNLPSQVVATQASQQDLSSIQKYIQQFCDAFGTDISTILNHSFYILTPNTQNPYKQLYTHC